MKELDNNTIESSELVEQTFKFWFNDNEHLRSPFPEYIHSELKPKATALFYEWVNGLAPNAKDEINDETVGEKFEEFIFSVATTLIKTEDERITIIYPFLPRLEDSIKDENGLECEIINRSIIKTNDTSFLKVVCKRLKDGEQWDTSFELPI